MHLLSPQHMAQQTTSVSDGFHSKLKYDILTVLGLHWTIHHNTSNNLLILLLASDFSSSSSTSNNNSTTDTSHASLFSSTEYWNGFAFKFISFSMETTQSSLQMGHLHMAQIQKIAWDGLFGPCFTFLGNCDTLLCKACIHGKQHWQAVTTNSAAGILDISHLEPGDCASGDQVESTTSHTYVLWYHAGTLFINHASRYLHFTPHNSTGMAKHSFELLALQHNRFIKCYHTDNGIFASKYFCFSCTQQKQCIKFCGIKARHQNGITEQHIRSITEHARTILIHAMISWSDIITEQLWPFAFHLAGDLHNTTPGPSGLTPEEFFTGIKSGNHFSDFHPCCCPIFMLDPSLQQGNKIPRWKPHSCIGTFLGFSPEHASSIPLVLSTTTGLVNPQFHVVFNDYFTTTNFLRQILYLPIGLLFLQLLVKHLLTKMLILLNSFARLGFKILLCSTLLLMQIIASILHLLLRGSHLHLHYLLGGKKILLLRLLLSLAQVGI